MALDRLRVLLAERELPALLVSDVENVGWLTGFSGSFGQALVTPERAVFVTDSRYALQAQEETSGMDVRVFASPMDGDTFLAQCVRELGADRLGFEADRMTFQTYDRLRTRLDGVELVPAPGLLARLRMVKSAAEVDAIRRACGIADATFAHLCRKIAPGVTEFDLGLELEFFIRRSGAGIAFPPIVVSGERSARPHGRASEKPLESGDFLTLDFGATVDGYHSDITRTVVVGEATDRHREVYGQVLKAQLAALDAMRPGVPAREVDAVARRVLDEIGLAKFFGHGLGHGLGRAVHDGGRMNATSSDVLEPGQVWTVEPGVYLEGFGGVRIEDDVVVTDDGIEILTRSPKELRVLPGA